MKSIQDYFGLGSIVISEPDLVSYRVESLEILVKIIPHFYKFPLITQLPADYELFKEVVYMMDRKLHLTPEGRVSYQKL